MYKNSSDFTSLKLSKMDILSTFLLLDTDTVKTTFWFYAGVELFCDLFFIVWE